MGNHSGRAQGADMFVCLCDLCMCVYKGRLFCVMCILNTRCILWYVYVGVMCILFCVMCIHMHIVCVIHILNTRFCAGVGGRNTEKVKTHMLNTIRFDSRIQN